MEKYNASNSYCLVKVNGRYPNSNWLVYDWGNNPCHLAFKKNEKIENADRIELKFTLGNKAKIVSFLKNDYFLSDALALVSERFANLFQEYAKEDVQLVKASIFQSNTFITKAFVPIFLKKINAIDKELSIFDENIGDYIKIEINKELSNLPTAFIIENNYMVFSEVFAKICKKNKIKGVDFYRFPFEPPLFVKDPNNIRL